MNVLGNTYQFSKVAGAECIINTSNETTRLFYFDNSKSGKISRLACKIGTNVFGSSKTEIINVRVQSQFRYVLDTYQIPVGSIRDFMQSETKSIVVSDEIKNKAIEDTIIRIKEAATSGEPDVFLELRTLKNVLEASTQVPAFSEPPPIPQRTHRPVPPIPSFPSSPSERLGPPAPLRPPVDTPKQGLVSEATVRAKFVKGGLPSANALYSGGSKVEFTVEGQNIALPRTLYQLFFISFLMNEYKGDVDPNPDFPLHQTAIFTASCLDDGKARNRFFGAAQTTDANVQKRIAQYLIKQNINSSNIQWKDVDNFLNHFFTDLDRYKNSRKEVDSIIRIYKSLDIRNRTVAVTTQDVLKKIVAMEWTAPAGTYHFYRVNSILNEKLINEQGKAAVLRFATSPIDGLFDLSRKPIVADYKEKNEELYCLELTEKEACDYLFIHKNLEFSPLTGLAARDEFADPILKTKIDGSHILPLEYNRLKKGQYYLSSPLAENQTHEAFSKHISQLFENHIKVIATNTNRLNEI